MNRLMLLVEDNPTDELLTVRAFRKQALAIDVVIAHDGREALDFMFGAGIHVGRDVSARPALVLLDLKLPRISGLEVLARVRADERTRTVPMVILTASREDQDVARSYQLGVNAYLRKPVDFAEFVLAAESITTFWLVLNEAPPRQRSEAP